MKRVQFPQDFFVHKHGHRFIILYTNMAAVTACENDLFSSVTKDGGYGHTNWNKQLSPALNTPIDISVSYIYKQVLFISALQHYGMYTDDHANYTAVSVTMIANTFMTDWPIQKILTSGKKKLNLLGLTISCWQNACPWHHRGGNCCSFFALDPQNNCTWSPLW